jgi:hypothetical protein
MDNKTTKSKEDYVKLDTPEDARDLICDVLTEIRDGSNLAENAGKICNLLQVWTKLYAIERLPDHEERISRLEESKK